MIRANSFILGVSHGIVEREGYIEKSLNEKYAFLYALRYRL